MLREKRRDATRPDSQQVGKRKHPAITKTLIMMMIMAVTPEQNYGEEKITRGHECGQERTEVFRPQ